MNPLDLISDGYERKARLYPALLLMLPMLVTALAISSGKLSVLQSVGATIGACGGAALLSHLARDAGKRKERELFALWGGVPSVVIFRHRDPRLDASTKARYHKMLGALVKGSKVPSSAEEEAEPAGADQVYTAWSTYLRVNTRDTKKYSLVFQENVNYGYRRNVWGLRPLGIVTSSISWIVAMAWCYQAYRATSTVGEEAMGAALFALIFLLLWIFRFSPKWVRIPADAYAERLAETVDSLGIRVATAKK